MRISEPPTVDRAGKGNPGDELDTLLRAFFQSELPHPWPALPLPETEAPARPVVPFTPPAASHPWVPVHSRLALAASVGLLLAGSWFLAGQFQPADSGDLPPRPDAVYPAKGGHMMGPDGIKMKESLEQEKDKPTKYRIELWDRR
jgi:hypothetical protein